MVVRRSAEAVVPCSERHRRRGRDRDQRDERYELAALATRGRVGLDPDAGVWIADALANPSTVVLPVDADIAIAGAQIPRDDFPGDPADRIIYATARVHGIPLVTKDRALRAFPPRGTVW